MTRETAYMQTPLGMLELCADSEALLSVLFLDSEPPAVAFPPASSLLQQTIAQLDEYFNGDRVLFELPLSFDGSDFQNRVWKELTHIPYGDTISYLELARRLGDEKCIRAAGSANGRNRHAIIVPCHRVIGSGGKLVGYAGGLWRKEWLLKHEIALAPKKAGRLF
jgi:methylated-DNA-[protein]-cysteine S-methyltransferase